MIFSEFDLDAEVFVDVKAGQGCLLFTIIGLLRIKKRQILIRDKCLKISF
jgi:hypothetical protein